MKAVKYAIWAVGGVVFLVLLALAAALIIVDGNFVKNRAERYMKEIGQWPPRAR